MPKVKFVVEHQVVEAQAGRKLRDIAQDAGINVDREFFRGVNCHGLGLCGCCKVWVHPSNRTALNPLNLRERIFGMSQGRRLACQARVAGDVEVTSMPGGDDRLERKREISPTPGPVHDAGAIRKPVDEGASIAYPLGHPSAVGKGEVPTPALAEPATQEPKPTATKGEPAKQNLSATTREAPKAKADAAKEKPADAKPQTSTDPPAEAKAEASKGPPAEAKAEASKDPPAEAKAEASKGPPAEAKAEASKGPPAEAKAEAPKEDAVPSELDASPTQAASKDGAKEPASTKDDSTAGNDPKPT